MKIEEIAALSDWALATGPFGSSIGSKTFRDSGVPLIRGSNLSSEIEVRIDDKGLVFVDEELAQKFKRSEARTGDLVFTCWGTINQVGLIDERAKYDRYIVSNKQMKFTPDPEKANPLFLYYWFSGPEGQRTILSGGIGSSIPGFNLGQLRNIRVPLPLLVEQTAIANFLAALDDKIELNRRMNETLEAMARAIFRDWFVDFGPTRSKMDGREPYLAPDLWAVFPDRLDDDGKPEGWEQMPLSAFFSILGGGTPKTSTPEYWDGDLPWFSVVDTPAPGNVFVVKTEKTITNAGLDASSARLVPSGTTIISARGTVGNLAMAAQEMAFNQSCYALRSVEGIGDYFVYLSANDMVDRLRAMSHGSVFSTITRRTFDSLSLPMPSSEVLNRIDDIVEPLFSRIKQNVLEKGALVATRDLLLPKLMSGEIRIAEAGQQADQALQGVTPFEAGASP